jgi:hypothetical protein
MKSAIFLIESGKPLQMIKQHIEEVVRVRSKVRQLCESLGVTGAYTDQRNGVLLGVVFNGKVHGDFSKPKRNVSYPKSGSVWGEKFSKQTGYADPSDQISKAFNVPMHLEYVSPTGSGNRCIGAFLNECGYLYLSKEGPYAMWIPDVAAEVAEEELRGNTPCEKTKSFKMEIEGCKRIEDEEWEIIVLQSKLAKKKLGSMAGLSSALSEFQ